MPKISLSICVHAHDVINFWINIIMKHIYVYTWSFLISIQSKNSIVAALSIVSHFIQDTFIDKYRSAMSVQTG